MVQIELIFECEHIIGVVESVRVAVDSGAVDSDTSRREIQAHDLD